MTTPDNGDAKTFFDIANRFVNLANDSAEEHGRPRVAAAILWAASRYSAFTWAMSGASERQTPEEALDLFCDQYRKMLADNIRLMREESAAPPA